MTHIHHRPDFQYCEYEPIVPRLDALRVVIVNDLIQEPHHLSDVARQSPDFDEEKWLKLERHIAGLALLNIETNVRKLVRNPWIRTVHFSELSEDLMDELDPDALVLSGTLRDFDFYNPELIEDFNRFIRHNRVPVLAICGGHQLVGQAFGAAITTLDGRLPAQRRTNRQIEYQYRFVKITDPDDPIFAGVDDRAEPRWQKYTHRRHLLRVWQNHGLQVDRLPDGFKQLARGYLAEVQMFVRRTAQQLIYGVQFHLEKSFQDWNLDKYWEHHNESRDGRMLFGNFLVEALRFRQTQGPRERRPESGSGPDLLRQSVVSSGTGSAPLTGF
ncbi:MAG: gamma-glutamyl-gamma-aminobutyrate hydrolase family protein [Blastocatellia bacterium]